MYLLDTNIYINFYDRYYPINHFATFWEKFIPILQNQIMISDVVVRENMHNPWFKSDLLANNYQKDFIDHRNYQEEWVAVLNYIANSDVYSDKALIGDRAWTNENIADGWLIAIAKKENCTIVSDELPNPNLNSLHKSKNPKVPDVAKADPFNVRCINMLQFFDEVNLKV